MPPGLSLRVCYSNTASQPQVAITALLFVVFSNIDITEPSQFSQGRSRGNRILHLSVPSSTITRSSPHSPTPGRRHVWVQAFLARFVINILVLSFAALLQVPNCASIEKLKPRVVRHPELVSNTYTFRVLESRVQQRRATTTTTYNWKFTR